MKREYKNVMTLSGLECSPLNVNAANVSSDDIMTNIAANNYDMDKILCIAGKGVKDHKEGWIIQGNNTFTALRTLVELARASKIGEAELIDSITNGEGIPICIVSECTELEIAELYDDNGIAKGITYPQVVKKARKYFEAGESQFKVALRLESNLQVLSPLKGDTILKVRDAKADRRVGKLKDSEYQKIIGEARYGIIQGIKAMSCNDVTVALCELKFNGETDYDVPEYMKDVSSNDFKKLSKAFEVDRSQLDMNGVRVYTVFELADGVTPEFQKAYTGIKARLFEKSKKPAGKSAVPMMSKAEIKAALEVAKSKHLQRILNVILRTDSVTKLSTLDNDLLKAESPKAKEKEVVKAAVKGESKIDVAALVAKK